MKRLLLIGGVSLKQSDAVDRNGGDHLSNNASFLVEPRSKGFTQWN